MSMNITYLGKGSADVKYASAKPPRRLEPSDFPIFDLISPHMMPKDREKFAPIWLGISRNPFMVEAFIAAIKEDRYEGFFNGSFPADMPISECIASRFLSGPEIANFDNLRTRLVKLFPKLGVTNLNYYAITFHMGCLDRSRPAAALNENRMARALGICQAQGDVVMPGYEKLRLLTSLTRHVQNTKDAGVEKLLVNLLPFTTDEITTIISDLPSNQWTLPGRIKQAMGCVDYTEVAAIMETMSLSLLEGLLPPE